MLLFQLKAYLHFVITRSSYVSSEASKSTGLSRSEDKAHLPEDEVDVQRQNFNRLLEVCRQLIRVMMSY